MVTCLNNFKSQTFPHFRHHATFIMGESYGGVYVPTLTARILDGQKDFPINLKVRQCGANAQCASVRKCHTTQGIVLGNAWLAANLFIDTSVRFAYAHGVIDEGAWNALEKECCGGCIDSCELSQLSNDWAFICSQAVFVTLLLTKLFLSLLHFLASISFLAQVSLLHIKRFYIFTLQKILGTGKV
ncbi:hypothetical protein OSTOST_14762 [Ostertagia ostertagi]